MRLSSSTTLPNTTQRIASVLRSKGIRNDLAKMAAQNELTSHRELGFSSTVIAEHLEKTSSEEGDLEFFNSRRISEAIILTSGRPVLFIRDGIIDKANVPALESKLATVRQDLVAPIASVGRIELADHDTFDWCGTGWRVDEDFIVTNRHVANIFSQREGTTFRFRVNRADKPIRAHIDFREEYKAIASEEFAVAEIVWIAPDSDSAPDMAILKIKRDPGLPAPLVLADKDPISGQLIGVVGYPARDSRNDASLMSEIFGDIYDVKRFAPGEVVNPGNDRWYLTHDATTLGGNSGSSVLDLETQRVVGLHFGGSFRKTNYAVKASTIRDILKQRTWIVSNETVIKTHAEAFKETKRTVAFMNDRKGYDDRFLGKKVSTPTAGSTHQILTTDFEKNLLPYTHYSVLMSSSRRFPIFTAENLDGALKKKLKRRDSWGYDPRIPKSAQVGHVEFYGPEPFDKGHMVRRENPGWGSTLEEAQLGEDDTFVYTNAIPQMPQLNQKSWLSLENYVLENARVEGFRICVFTGPVFRSDDPAYSGVQVPTDFWKVIVALDADSGNLLSSSYLLSQEGLMPVEGFRYGPFKTYQVPLKRVEEISNVHFAKAIKDADVFTAEEVEEMITMARYIEINSEDDIVLTPVRV